MKILLCTEGNYGNEFMVTLHEKIEKYFNESFSWPDTDIYHYTKKGNGNKIIKSSVFKLTSHCKLNQKKDNGELLVGPELTNKYLTKTSLISQEANFNEMAKRGITLHIGSFCEEKNNSHAIKTYGPDCLEFKAEYLRKLSETHALIGSVIYDTKKQDEIISTILGLHEEKTDEDPKWKCLTLFLWLWTIFPLLKQEKHYKDIECRIITVHGYEKNDPEKRIGTARDQINFTNDDVILLTSVHDKT